MCRETSWKLVVVAKREDVQKEEEASDQSRETLQRSQRRDEIRRIRRRQKEV